MNAKTIEKNSYKNKCMPKRIKFTQVAYRTDMITDEIRNTNYTMLLNTI